ncbi:hypothetical protein F0562_007386 [Nyssa sinensis]|uniref:Histone-lysine N-methyltransferase n=1 Tax=Nyssa sinensis TaxID=561372 RepID=A0A5J5A7X2_9ASTE|nr:hypothetical protein F0562_007386 [Nyssa sinensis]
MDNSWQMKCSSTWQSLTSLMASSSQLQPLESRNQMLNAGHYLYPHVAQEPSSAARGMIQEPMFPKASNLNSYISGHAEMGSSFLSLLSGPPSLLQCNLQPFPKPFIASSKVPVDGSCSIMVSTAESKVLPPPAGPLSQDLRNQNPKVGADLCAVVSSRELISANYGTGLLSQNLRNQSPKIGADPCPVASSRRVASANCGSLQDVLQAANLNLQNSELSKAVIHHIVPGNEKVKDISSPMGNWLTGARPANVGKPHATNIQASQKFQLQMNSPLSHQSSTLTSGCPRVFCLGASGNLLLSNTGLLGVVCSCHGLHMSVSKFSEHSGLCDVNPGDAVYMDSGETIAQWRRLYFHKFGIRVPEDHSGWDWPEGFSATAGLVKHSATVPNMSKNSDAPNLNNTSGAFVGSGQSWNNVVIPKNPHTGQKLVNEVIHNEKQRNAQDSCNFLFKGLTGTSQSNLHPRADNQIVECPISGCSTMSKLAGIRGPDNGCQSISAYIDSISKSGNLITSHPNLQNSETPGKDFDFSRFSNSKEGDIVDRDTVPSNIELRLGQPSQQTRTLGNSCLPMFGSHLFDTIGDPQKSHFLEQLIHNTSNSVVMEECRQHLKHAADTSISNARREQSQFNNMNHGSGVNNITHAAKIEQFKGDEARGPVISMLLSHLKNSAEGKLHFKATNNLVNGNEHVMPRTPCESHTAKCESINFLRNRGDGTEKQSSINEIGLHKHMDKGKGLGSDANGSHVATESSFNFPTKHLENTSSFSAVAGGTGHHSSAIRDKNSHLYQFSGMSPDASDTRNAFNYFGKLSCLGHNGNLDNFFLRSISSPMDPGSVLPSQAVSMGFSATTSISVPSLTPALPNKDSIGLSPYLLDENMRRIACRHIMESYNQDPAISSFGTNQENGRFINSCGVKLQGSAVDPLMSKERVHGPNITGKQDISEVATKSIQSGVTWMSRDREKLAPVAGLNKWCDFSTFSQGPLLHSKEMETHCQLSRDPHAVEQSSLRSENNITSSSEHGKCCQRAPYTYFPGKCTCAVHTNCLVGDCDFKGKTSLDASRELAESVGGKDSSSTDFSTKKISKCVAQRKSRYLGKFLENAEDGKCHVGEMYNANKSTKEYHCQSSILDLDTFCCVCGSSNKEETNCLLECSRCWIRVHQACYGVSKVPKAWYCRPCRTSSKNIVCVLCGYGGGAMTRALRSRNIVKSLLKAWKIVTESRPKNTISPCEALEDQLRIMNSKSGLQNDLYPVFRHVHVESSSTVWKMDLQKQLDSVKNLSCSSSNLKVDNSITAGILDSTVKQWVHMVCGLWTPGTRCPNVDTMSAFDVSGAFCPNGNVVCSMCNRPGGSCIQCRVVDCCVQFHPWCAHQKGLLQSEVEGVDNESVGFYGRCVLHATYHLCDSDGDPIDTETAHPGENESTCARTEGYKGRKREGFQHNPSCQSNGSGLPKLPISDIEYDCRKEYTRYKQSKGWKRLVVYKSGIHALGLYTSRFIPRGAMVVEYVGEIVGLRVADKRESEYQSGRKLQYKSACYFFRIDKEHIIDATRKGGIARFVNHSCLPNCVAKVISVRNEKKVVFFAERDIYPGEEITYDYHFNHEDEEFDDKRSPSTWLRSRAHELPEIKGKCRNLISRMGRHRRNSADFSYDPLSYALNFDDGAADDDRDDGSPVRNFSRRLPRSPPTPRSVAPQMPRTETVRSVDPRMPRAEIVRIVTPPRLMGEKAMGIAMQSARSVKAQPAVSREFLVEIF